MALEWWNPFSWFESGASDWLGGLGGDIGSGIEGGFVAVVKDMLKVILPWLEIVAGALIIAFTLLIYFREQTTQAGVAIGKAALA